MDYIDLKGHFGITDYIVIGLTIGVSFAIGIYFGIKSKSNNDELLMGGRHLKSLPIACSMIVTWISGITVIGLPGEIYAFGIQLAINLPIFIIFCIISAIVFIPFFYDLKLVSIYEYLEIRFESRAVRQFSSLIFIIHIIIWSSIVLYTPAIALETFMGLPIYVSILLVGLSGSIYTCIGGFKAVIYTDVLQFAIMIFGMIAVVTKGIYNVGGISQVFQIAQEHGRLDISFEINPFIRLNFLNILLGQAFTSFMLYGCNQLQIQRFCSVESSKEAIKAVVYKMFMTFFLWGIVVLAGIVIYSNYAGCDPILLGEIKKADEILPYFVVDHLGFIPGMCGLFAACIFSAVLSSVSSSINSIAAITWKDFLAPFEYFQKISPKSQANLTRCVGFLYGCLFIGLAFLSPKIGMVWSGALSVIGATNGPIGSIFILGIFCPFANKQGVIFGSLFGLVAMCYITIVAIIQNKSHIPLESSLESCSTYQKQSFSNRLQLTMIENSTLTEGNLLESYWIEKISTLSFTLYPFLGAIISLSTGIMVSLLTGGYKKEYRDRINPHLHHWIRKSKPPLLVESERDILETKI